jgi:3-oxoacyl-[acyl-carrier-protein] synthase II
MAHITSERRSLLRRRLSALVRDVALSADIEAQVDHLLAEVFDDDPLTAPDPLLIDELPDDQRIVVTGMGLVTPFGIGLNPFWQNLVAGHSAVGPITRFDTSDFPCRIAGEVDAFTAQDFMDFKEARRMSRASQFAVAAGRMAAEDANLRIADVGSDQVGILIGCGTTSMPDIEQAMTTFIQRHPMKINPFFIPAALPNMPASQLAIQLGVHGYTSAICTACAASAQAIGEAAAVLRRGDATVMLAGGTEAPISAFSLGSFCVMRALSMRNEEPQRASRPFDADRDGFVPAEGAGVLVLETLASARRRNARVYVELLGYGSSCDAYHVTAPDPRGEGAARAIRRAFANARIDPQQVDYINAHATSTPTGDIAETRAIKHVFGEYAYSVPISAPKSMLGHLTGAAGVVEAAATILALRHGRIPPTINLERPDDECDLDYVPHTARRADLQIAVSNSFGFGGVNAVLVFRRYEA